MNISSGTSVLDSSPRIAILVSGFFLVILAENIANCAPGEDYKGEFQEVSALRAECSCLAQQSRHVKFTKQNFR